MIVFQMPQEYHELPEQVQQNVLTCLKVRREQLTDALLREHYKRKLPTVIDYDWRLKVSLTIILSTSALINQSLYLFLTLLASLRFFIVGNGFEQDGLVKGISTSVGSHSRR